MPRIAKNWFVCSIAGSMFVLAGCDSGGEVDAGAEMDVEAEADAAPMADSDMARVEIVQPAEGSTVTGPDVPVALRAVGVQVVPADNRQTPGRGHHHLFLDVDQAAAGAPVAPTGGGVVHMGDGSEEYTFTAVEPGEHRIIAQLAYGDHVPMEDVQTDTVTFTVAAP